MATWILTIGNSDVQLNKDEHWQELYKSVKYESPFCECSKSFVGIGKYYDPTSGLDKNKDEETKRYIPPARVLGLVYGQLDAKKYYQSDLVFPLLDTLIKGIKENQLTIDRVIIVLTNQDELLKDDVQNENSP